MLEARVLVASCDTPTLVISEAFLEDTVRHVDRAIDSDAALALFCKHKHPVVLLDLFIQPMRGLEVLRRIRALDSRTQVVIRAPYVTTEDAIEALNLHAFHLLMTPWTIRDLQAAVVEAYALYQRIRVTPEHGE